MMWNIRASKKNKKNKRELYYLKYYYSIDLILIVFKSAEMCWNVLKWPSHLHFFEIPKGSHNPPTAVVPFHRKASDRKALAMKAKVPPTGRIQLSQWIPFLKKLGKSSTQSEWISLVMDYQGSVTGI